VCGCHSGARPCKNSSLVVETSNGVYQHDEPIEIHINVTTGDTIYFRLGSESLTEKTTFFGVGWFEGRGVMAPLQDITLHDEEGATEIILAASVHDIGRFTAHFEVSEASLTRMTGGRITGRPVQSDFEGCHPAPTAHFWKSSRFNSCPTIRWERVCKTVILTVLPEGETVLPRLPSRLVDDPVFIDMQHNLPSCGVLEIGDTVDENGHFSMDLVANPQLGRWVTIAAPLRDNTILATLLWPPNTAATYDLFLRPYPHTAWVPYGCRFHYLEPDAVRKCLRTHPIAFSGESRARTQLYNIVLLWQKMNPTYPSFPKGGPMQSLQP
jgi:hypothetical protein